MANLNFGYSSAKLRTIQEIQFGLLSPEDIKNMSVAKIEYAETMDEAKMRPREGGLNDPKLGSIDRSFRCETCDEDMTSCPGHFGHIELATPVFHIGFVNKVKKILEIICHNCGKILVDESNPEFADALRIRNSKRRFDTVWRLCKPKFVCEQAQAEENEDGMVPKEPKHDHGGCGNTQPSIKRDGLKLMGTWKVDKDDEAAGAQPEQKVISASRALEIFRHISSEDIRKMGLSNDYARPEWMIITVLPVPPPPVRPSISVDGTGQGMRGEDDLTYKLGDIIRANSNVAKAESEGSPQHIVTQFQDLLQFHVATYMDNDIAGQPQALQKSGRPVKSIRARLKGKEGRLRGNLMGKRVDFSARTVITGDPNLSLDEVGVPRSIARTLTYPETVTPFNIDRLKELVKNGPNEHPGARYVVRDTGERIDLRHHKRAGDINLQYGWKVERHVVDGDFVIFNRQPSLHKESMMGHRVRVMPFSTFRMNLSATSPYNADFDGDEMNLHVPQSEETRSEVSNICMVPKQIITPQKNSPIMGIVQDTLCGIYKISRRDNFIPFEQVMAILLWVDDWDGVLPTPAIIKPMPMWSGKQIISMALPSGLDVTKLDKDDKVTQWRSLTDEGACIIDGELVFGQLNKGMVGASGNGVIHVTYNDQGPAAALKFFNAAQRIVAYWLLHNGFSIGIGDTIPDDVTINMVNSIIAKQKDQFKDLINSATDGTLEPQPGQTIRTTFENKASSILGLARSMAGKEAMKTLKEFNAAVQMSSSGSKGSSVNISQMSALVGQQAVEGSRMPFGFKYRTLPHFTKDDYSPEARGFCENSYLQGLTPTEFFFHAMSGREGLIDTAVKTAETGYIQRRLVKAMEDVQARYDGTVRNSLGDIIQFTYGEDGLDAVHIEGQKIDIILPGHEAFEKKYRVDVNDDDSPFLRRLEQESTIQNDPESQAVLEEEFDAIRSSRDFLREERIKAGDMEDSFHLPFNISRILETARSIYKLNLNARSDLHPLEAVPMIRDTIERLIIVPGDDPISKEAQENATIHFRALLRSRLAFKPLVERYNMSKLALRHVLGEIEGKFARAAVNPGEMVGVLAAQSIGEPATQMTLNTFHFTGIATKNVTLGVPRLKEILNIATNIKTPSMRVYQLAESRESREGAQALRAKVEHTNLKTLTHSTEIYYDPDVETTVIDADRDMVEAYWVIPDDSVPGASRQSRWVLRIVLERRKMLDKALSVAEVAGVIQRFFGSDQLAILFSDDNAQEQVIRIRLITDKDLEEEEDDDLSAEHELLRKLEPAILNRLTIGGVPAIDRAFLSQYKLLDTRPDGEIAMIQPENGGEGTGWFLDTSGSALRSVLAIPGVDSTLTYTNRFTEALDVLGIEGCRTSILREITQVLSFDGSYVNARHLSLLVDIMTVRGWLVPITRHGINKAETGALMRCSFEETVEILLDAAASGELDDCRGVSENIMLGQQAPLGTGDMDILLDQNMLDTVISDNSRLGIVPSMALQGGEVDGAATPYGTSPVPDTGYLGGASPDYGAAFSPINSGSESPDASGIESGMSPYRSGFSPGTPSWMGGTSPGFIGSPASPMYSPTSPAGFAGTPGFSPSSPAFTPASPHYSPTSPAHSPTSPSYSPSSPNFSPTSPSYSPTSPGGMQYSPSSPKYSPTSPNYSPTSPAAQRHSPTSPRYSPTSPNASYSPTSPAAAYSPTSPAANYSPTSPRADSPRSPSRQPYSPTSPKES